MCLFVHLLVCCLFVSVDFSVCLQVVFYHMKDLEVGHGLRLVKATFADFQTKVCDKLVRNGVKIETCAQFKSP